MIQFCAEYDMTDFQDIDFAQQRTSSIRYGQHIAVATTDFMHHLSQFHIRTNTLIVTVNDRVKAHQCQHSMVGMVSHQSALLSQSHAIDAMRLKDDDGQIGRNRHNHQRHKEVEATRYLSNEEDACQWGMHHTRHHTSHTQQREVLLWHINPYLMHVPKTREQESCKTANEQRGRKCTTTTSASVGG